MKKIDEKELIRFANKYKKMRILKHTIEGEGNYKAFEYKGYKCRILRSDIIGCNNTIYLSGYVAIPKGHKYFRQDIWKKNSLDELKVHGGITYSSNKLIFQPEKNVWWIGFSCDSIGDIAFLNGCGFADVTYKTMDYVEKELKGLVDQLKKG